MYGRVTGDTYGSKDGDGLASLAHYLRRRVSFCIENLKDERGETYGKTMCSVFLTRKNRLGACNMKSPRIAAIRLDSGVTAFWVPVSNGEPWVTSSGYRRRSRLICELDAVERGPLMR